MNSEKSSQQESNKLDHSSETSTDRIHVLILMRSDVQEDTTQEEMPDSIEEFTFITSRNQAKFLEYTKKYVDMTPEDGTIVVGNVSLEPVAMTGFSTPAGNPIVHAISGAFLEFLKQGAGDYIGDINQTLSIN